MRTADSDWLRRQWRLHVGVVLAYGYLLAPLILPILSPLARLVPARVKEVLT